VLGGGKVNTRWTNVHFALATVAFTNRLPADPRDRGGQVSIASAAPSWRLRHKFVSNSANRRVFNGPLLDRFDLASYNHDSFSIRGERDRNRVQLFIGRRYRVFLEDRADLARVARPGSGGGCCSPAIAHQTLT